MSNSDKYCPDCLNLNQTKYISANRILIIQDKNKEGFIEIRPGLEDASLEEDKKWGICRIWLGASNIYIKGMGVYSNDIPDGFDFIWYTSLTNIGTLRGYNKGRREHAKSSFELVPPDRDWKAFVASLERPLVAYGFILDKNEEE